MVFIRLDDVEQGTENGQLKLRRRIFNVGEGGDEEAIEPVDQIPAVFQLRRPMFDHLEEEGGEEDADRQVFVVVQTGVKDFFQRVSLREIKRGFRRG